MHIDGVRTCVFLNGFTEEAGIGFQRKSFFLHLRLSCKAPKRCRRTRRLHVCESEMSISGNVEKLLDAHELRVAWKRVMSKAAV